MAGFDRRNRLLAGLDAVQEVALMIVANSQDGLVGWNVHFCQLGRFRDEVPPFVFDLDHAFTAFKSAADRWLVGLTNQLDAVGVPAAELRVRRRIKQTALRQVLGVDVFDFDRSGIIHTQAPLSHVVGMAAEVRDLAAGIVVVETKTVETAIFVVRCLAELDRATCRS